MHEETKIALYLDLFKNLVVVISDNSIIQCCFVEGNLYSCAPWKIVGV